MRASSRPLSTPGRPVPSGYRRADILDDPESTNLLKWVLLSKKQDTIAGKPSQNVKLSIPKSDGYPKAAIRNLDTIPESPIMADREICFADPPTRLFTVPPNKNSWPVTAKCRWRSTQFEIHRFNELEYDMVRYGIKVMASVLKEQQSLLMLVLISIACSALFLSSVASICQSVYAVSRSSAVTHALIAAMKALLAFVFCLWLLYSQIRNQDSLVPTVYAVTSLCAQFVAAASSVYFNDPMRQCFLDESPRSGVTSENLAKRTVWPFAADLIILLITTLVVNLYFLLLIQQLISTCRILQHCKIFMGYFLAALILLEMGSAAALVSWILHASCYNYVPVPSYLADLTYIKRLQSYGWRESPKLLVVLGCLSGLSVPTGILSVGATHLEYIVTILAAILASEDRSFSKYRLQFMIPDHVTCAARTYLAWFHERHTIWRYGSLWNAAKTMRRRERVRHVISRVFISWIWYLVAVVAPIIIAAQCSSAWTENNGNAVGYFIAPTVVAIICAVLANPLSVVVAPVTIVLFAVWFLALIAVQAFYFCTFVLYPNTSF